MLAALIISVALNVFLAYAWFHDLRKCREGYDRLERLYHTFIDYHRGDPEGTTSLALIEAWPEGSELRHMAEEKHIKQYGSLEVGRARNTA